MSDDLTGLNLVELYDRLVVPDAPAPVSMWPQTAGWIWLMLGLVIVGSVVGWKIAAWRQATAYRRAALAELRAAGDDPVAIAIVLRRTALSGFPREAVAGLHGAEWLAFLDGAAGKVRFDGSEAGVVLAKAPYTPQAPHKDLSAMAETWIRTHRASGAGS
jgi:hypothetical protein